MMEAGAKVAVAPAGSPVAASVTGLANVPFCALTVMEYWALPPGSTVWGCVDAVMVKLGATVPVPLRDTVWGDPDALSASDSVAVKLPVAAGVKVTERVQFEPAARDSPQVLVWLKSEGLAPVRVIPVMVRVALPGFESMTTWAVAVVFTVAV